LLDLTMPRMGGEATFQQLRLIRGDVRVILSSGYSEEEATQRFAGEGLAGFIQKPYQSATLKAKLREVLQQ
jgi:CheY-like chemotaxis protein